MATNNDRRPWRPERVRQRIQVTQLINRLQKCANGEVEMTPTQIRAAEIVLKKALPDLSAVEHSGLIEHRKAEELSDAELAAIAAGRDQKPDAGSEELH